MMSEEQDEFARTVADQFSVAERSMGREMYDANLAHTKTINEALRHEMERMDTKARRYEAVTFIGLLMALLTYIPAYVLFWKFVLRW